MSKKKKKEKNKGGRKVERKNKEKRSKEQMKYWLFQIKCALTGYRWKERYNIQSFILYKNNCTGKIQYKFICVIFRIHKWVILYGIYLSLSELLCLVYGAPLVGQMVKSLPAMQETWVLSLGWEDPLEKEMATHSSIHVWKITWTEEPSRLQGSKRVGHDWATNTSTLHSVYVYSICMCCTYIFQMPPK